MFPSNGNLRELSLAIRNDRIRANCWISYDPDEDPIEFRCIIDTGAMITVIPQRVWEPFAAQMNVQNCPVSPIRGMGGRALKAHVAQLHLMITGKEPNAMPFALGQCEVRLAYDRDAANADKLRPLDPGETEKDRIRELQHVLLGLGGGCLSRGGVCINWLGQEAVLVQT